MSFSHLLFFASATSCTIFFIASIVKNRDQLLKIFNKKNFFNSILLGLFNPFLYYLVLFRAYELLPAQEAQPLNFTWPIAIAVFSAIFLKHKLTRFTLVGMFVSFIGVFIIATHGKLLSMNLENPLGVSLAVGSSLLWASFWILSLVDKRPATVKLFSSFFVGTLFTTIYILSTSGFILPDLNYLGGAIYIGFFEMGITFFFWMKGLSLSNDKAKTSTLAFLSPFISFIFIASVLEEKITISSIVGLCFIIGGIIIQKIENFKISKLKTTT